MGQEVETMWRSKKSFGTTLFFLNRYIPPAAAIFCIYGDLFVSSFAEKFCKSHTLVKLLLDLAEAVFIQCTLIICTHALYQKRSLLVFLSSLVALVGLTIFISFMIFVPRCLMVTIGDLFGIKGCLSLCDYELAYIVTISWVPLLILETLTFVLTARKSYQSYTPYTSSWSKRVVGILLRDRLIYYIVLLGITVLSFLSMWSMVFPLTTYSIVGLQMGLQPAICTRLLLDLREAGNTVDTGNTAASANMESIAFAHQTPANESQASSV